MENTEFDSIRPYDDKEASEAFIRLSHNPALPLIAKYLFQGENVDSVPELFQKLESIDQFQDTFMVSMIEAILSKTSTGFSFDGLDNLKQYGTNAFLFISNHRDIVLDPALIQYSLRKAGYSYTQICVGSNLLSSQWIEDLMRSNRMIKVIRGISARELYLSSQTLSKYIRHTIKDQGASIWIAQREGRTKDGKDSTEQGLLKMFDMSGDGTFEENFKELNIVPVSISYEYEPCDFRKAREIYIKKTTGSYTKKPNEDLHSIMTGISQGKGHIHLEYCRPLSAEEIESAAEGKGNDRYQRIRCSLDERICGSYKLWKTNYMGKDILSGGQSYLGSKYSAEDLKDFETYINHKLSKAEKKIDKEELRKIFLGIYANPVI